METDKHELSESLDETSLSFDRILGSVTVLWSLMTVVEMRGLDGRGCRWWFVSRRFVKRAGREVRKGD